jgi:hypothetical protein
VCSWSKGLKAAMRDNDRLPALRIPFRALKDSVLRQRPSLDFEMHAKPPFETIVASAQTFLVGQSLFVEMGVSGCRAPRTTRLLPGREQGWWEWGGTGTNVINGQATQPQAANGVHTYKWHALNASSNPIMRFLVLLRLANFPTIVTGSCALHNHSTSFRRIG